MPPDKSSITFRINPKARFYNGDPVTAADVKHSFDMLTSKEAAPAVSRPQLDGRPGVDDRRRAHDPLRPQGPHRRHDLQRRPACPCSRASGARGPTASRSRSTRSSPSIRSRRARTRSTATDSGRRIDFSADQDYWARDLGVRKGQYNFDRVVYRLLPRQRGGMEAFKAGEFDLLQEFVALAVRAQHEGAKWRRRPHHQEDLRPRHGAGLPVVPPQPAPPDLPGPPRARGARLHLRLRDDQRLQACTSARTACSRTPTSPRQGMPSPGELALLEPFRNKLPPEVFGPPYVPPRTDTSPNALRDNLKKARDAARGGGLEGRRRRRPAQRQGRAVRVRVPRDAGQPAVPQRDLGAQPRQARHQVQACGIVDFALYRKRLETFDFDMITIRRPTSRFRTCSRLQGALRQRRRRTSRAPATIAASRIKAVDAMLEAMDAGQDAGRAARRGARARPRRHAPALPGAAALLARLPRLVLEQVRDPEDQPKYYTIDEHSDDWCRWAVTTWWIKDACASSKPD